MYLSSDPVTRSIRSTPSPDGELLLVGGSGHVTGRHEPPPGRRLGELVGWARATFPVTEERYRWSAQDYTTADEVPYVGRSPRMTRTFVATGFKKWGLTNGTAAAEMVADLDDESTNDIGVDLEH